MYLSVMKPKKITTRLAKGLVLDEQIMHEIMTDIFQKQRKEENLLYRKILDEKEPIILVQSKNPPASDLFEIETQDIKIKTDYIEAESVFRFRILTSPFVKYKGRRRTLMNVKKREDWLKRKANQNGFEIIACEEVSRENTTFFHKNEKGGKGTIYGFEYKGILRVKDKEKFIAAYKNGIGPYKAYGYGMMILF